MRKNNERMGRRQSGAMREGMCQERRGDMRQIGRVGRPKDVYHRVIANKKWKTKRELIERTTNETNKSLYSPRNGRGRLWWRTTGWCVRTSWWWCWWMKCCYYGETQWLRRMGWCDSLRETEFMRLFSRPKVNKNMQWYLEKWCRGEHKVRGEKWRGGVSRQRHHPSFPPGVDVVQSS